MGRGGGGSKQPTVAGVPVLTGVPSVHVPCIDIVSVLPNSQTQSPSLSDHCLPCNYTTLGHNLLQQMTMLDIGHMQQ